MGIGLKQEIINCKNNFSQFKNNRLVEPPFFEKYCETNFFREKSRQRSKARSQNSGLYNLFCSAYLDQSFMRVKHISSAQSIKTAFLACKLYKLSLQINRSQSQW